MTSKINKSTATKTTKSGNLITVTIEQGTWIETVSIDGHEVGAKTHLVDRMEIKVTDQSGKVLIKGDHISMITPEAYFSSYDEFVAKGIVARIGDSYISQVTLDLIDEVISEAKSNCEKTEEQIEIETVIAEKNAKVEAWENSPEGKAEIEDMNRHEELMREMDREDSDY
jgi:hypothetical protein